VVVASRCDSEQRQSRAVVAPAGGSDRRETVDDRDGRLLDLRQAGLN
jgi:hypothetical protein